MKSQLIGIDPNGGKDRRPKERAAENVEFPHETGLILKCAAKFMKLFQTKQRNRPSCGDQEGRSGSDEVVPGRCRAGNGLGIGAALAPDSC